MPATSKEQQHLMGIAYAVKKGYMAIEDVGADYRDKVKELVVSMSVEQLKDYAETDAKNLPDTATDESLGMANSYGGPQSISMPGAGIGKIALPDMGSGATGSGDVPKGQGDAEEEYKKQKKKRKKRLAQKLKTFEEYFSETNKENLI